MRRRSSRETERERRGCVIAVRAKYGIPGTSRRDRRRSARIKPFAYNRQPSIPYLTIASHIVPSERKYTRLSYTSRIFKFYFFIIIFWAGLYWFYNDVDFFFDFFMSVSENPIGKNSPIFTQSHPRFPVMRIASSRYFREVSKALKNKKKKKIT